MRNKNAEQSRIIPAVFADKYQSLLHQAEMKAREEICEIVYSCSFALEEARSSHQAVLGALRSQIGLNRDLMPVLNNIDKKFETGTRIFEESIDKIIKESAIQIKEITDLNKRQLDSVRIFGGRSYQSEKHCELILKNFNAFLRKIVGYAESNVLLSKSYIAHELELNKKMCDELSCQKEGRRIEENCNTVDFGAWVCDWWKQNATEEAA